MMLATICAMFLIFSTNDTGLVKHSTENYQLVWSDEFNKSGMVDTSVWHFENGFIRNNELQWYQPENVWRENGKLIIEGRRETRPNPVYNNGGDPSNTEFPSRYEVDYVRVYQKK